MNYDEAFQITGMLASLPYFPSEDIARAAIAKQVASMCRDLDQARWLMDRALQLWTKWEGPRELRALLCARHKPHDGIEVNLSTVFPDGIPSEKPPQAWSPKALPPGRAVTAALGVF